MGFFTPYAKFPSNMKTQGFRGYLNSAAEGAGQMLTQAINPQAQYSPDGDMGAPAPAALPAGVAPPTSAADLAAGQFGASFDAAAAIPGRVDSALTMTPEKYKAIGSAIVGGANRVKKAVTL